MKNNQLNWFDFKVFSCVFSHVSPFMREQVMFKFGKVLFTFTFCTLTEVSESFRKILKHCKMFVGPAGFHFNEATNVNNLFSLAHNL